MRRVLLAPDSYKGSLDALSICEIMSERILAYYPEADVRSIPMADGGEGTVDALLLAIGGEKIVCSVQDPLGDEIESYYGVLPDGTAVIEMAAAAGLPLVEGREDPGRASTYGVGQQVSSALDRGCRQFIIGLGGSATNDMAMGLVSALGARFLDREGQVFVPTGFTMEQIQTIDLEGLDERLQAATFTVMCDIDNPLYGLNGAAYVFAPQKGASPEDVSRLDRNLRHAAKCISESLEIEVDTLPGGGAAGGMGAGLYAFLGAKLRQGSELILDQVGFDQLLETADLVITGEGQVDWQTLSGKLVLGVSRRAREKRVPVLVVAGSIQTEDQRLYDAGVTAMLSINRRTESYSEARGRVRENLRDTMDSILRVGRIFEVRLD